MHYPIDPHWKAPAEPPRVLVLERSEYGWSCLPEDALAIQIDQPVAAVKVFWATSKGTQTMIVAPEPYATPLGKPASILLLGRPYCASENVPLADLERGVVLGLTAIRNDGSEVMIEGVPTFVKLDDWPSGQGSWRPIPLGFEKLVDEPRATPASAPSKPRSSSALPIILVLGAIAIGARCGLAGAMSEGALPKARVRGR
jgi:hypothetical protein